MTLWLDDNFQTLDLQPNWELMSPQFRFETLLDKPQIVKRDLNHMCYYTGKVHGFADSSVALSTCDGLVG